MNKDLYYYFLYNKSNNYILSNTIEIENIIRYSDYNVFRYKINKKIIQIKNIPNSISKINFIDILKTPQF